MKTQLLRFDKMDVNYCPGSGKVDVTAVFNEKDKPYALKLETEVPGTSVFYTLNGNDPDKNSFKYINPIKIDHDITLKAVAYKDEKQLEKLVEYQVDYHKAVGKYVTYREKYSERYPGNGQQTLNDGLRGSFNYNDGYWQGYNGNNLDVIINLGEDFTFNSIASTFLLDQKKWIFIPEAVNYYVSDDGQNFQIIASIKHNIPLNSDSPLTNDFTMKLNRPMKVSFLRVEAVNIGVCPDWHPGKGGKAWLFVDEIVVR
jgi:hexosaminidase